MQFADQVRSRVILKFISSKSKVILELFRYFNGTAISPFTVSSLPASFVNLYLNLIESDWIKLKLNYTLAL